MYRRTAFELLERRQLLTAGPLGDLNRDGMVTGADVPAMLAALADLDGYQAANQLSIDDLLSIADINGDGAVNNSDLAALLGAIRSGQLQPPLAPAILNVASDPVASNNAITNISAPVFIGTGEAVRGSIFWMALPSSAAASPIAPATGRLRRSV